MAVATYAAADDYVTLAAATMAGDLRDFLLDRLRFAHNPLPWHLRPETEQRSVVEEVERAVHGAVERACTTIAAGGQRAARGSLVKLQARTALQMQVDVALSDPLRHALVDAVGGTVLLVLADPEDYGGERAPVPIHRDQGDMLEAD